MAWLFRGKPPLERAASRLCEVRAEFADLRVASTAWISVLSLPGSLSGPATAQKFTGPRTGRGKRRIRPTSGTAKLAKLAKLALSLPKTSKLWNALGGHPIPDNRWRAEINLAQAVAEDRWRLQRARATVRSRTPSPGPKVRNRV